VIPNDPNRYGRYAANIVAGGDSNRDIIWTFAPGQTPKRWTVTDQGQAFENMNYIFPYTNFWLVNKNDGNFYLLVCFFCLTFLCFDLNINFFLLILKGTCWLQVGKIGKHLLVKFFSVKNFLKAAVQVVSPSLDKHLSKTYFDLLICHFTKWFVCLIVGLYLLRYRSSDQQLYVVPVPLTPDSYVPSHFEGAVFAAAGINNIAPAVNVCFVGFWSGTTFKATPYKLNPGPSTPSPFYGYNTVAAWSLFSSFFLSFFLSFSLSLSHFSSSSSLFVMFHLCDCCFLHIYP
jgi:hypothetical protein